MGSAQVARVVVCHTPRAAPEIEWKAFPPSWQSPEHVREEKNICVFGRGRKNEPDSSIISTFPRAHNKFKFYSEILSAKSLAQFVSKSLSR